MVAQDDAGLSQATATSVVDIIMEFTKGRGLSSNHMENVIQAIQSGAIKENVRLAF